MKCKIVTSTDCDAVENRINSLLSQGWGMKDRLIVTCYPGTTKYTQVMILKERREY